MPVGPVLGPRISGPQSPRNKPWVAGRESCPQVTGTWFLHPTSPKCCLEFARTGLSNVSWTKSWTRWWAGHEPLNELLELIQSVPSEFQCSTVAIGAACRSTRRSTHARPGMHMQQCSAFLDAHFSNILRTSVCSTIKLYLRFTFT